MADANLSRDLFGGVSAMPSGRRGRPAHRWSQESENLVLLGCAMGWSNERIARGVGVSVPSLRKHYFQALKTKDMARDRYELWRAKVLAEAAGAGNVTASRELDRIMQKHDRERASAEIDAAQDKARKAPAPVGKKEAAKADGARAAREGWGGLLRPGFGGTH